MFVSQTLTIPIPDVPFTELERLCIKGFDSANDKSKLLDFLIKSKIFLPKNMDVIKIHLKCFEEVSLERLNINSDGIEVVGPDQCDLDVLVVKSLFCNNIQAYVKEAKRPVLIWNPFGEQVSIGPLFNEKTATCPKCLKESVSRNVLGDLEDGVLDYPSNYCDSVGMAAKTLLEQELLKIKSSDFLTRNVVTFYPKLREYNVCHIYSSPNCLDCNRENVGDELDVVDFIPGSLRSMSSVEAQKVLIKLVNPLTGVLAKIIRNPNDAPVATIGLSSIGIKSKFLFDNVAFAMGKGRTQEQSELSCIGEAIERSTMTYFSRDKLITGKMSKLKKEFECINTDQLELFSDKQRSNWDQQSPDAYNISKFISPLFDEEEVIDWKLGFKLKDNKKVLLPASYFYRWDILNDKELFSIANSTGMASGFSKAEAVIHGCLELLERDAVGMWWYNELSLPGVPFKDLNSDYCESVVNHFEKMGKKIHLLHAKTDYRVHHIIAVSSNDDGRDINLGFGSGYDLKSAAERSVGEIAQITTSYKDKKSLNSSLCFEVQKYLKPNVNLDYRDFLHQNYYFKNSQQALEHLRQDSESIGHEIIYSNMDSDFPLTVMKVIIPGLIKHYSRNGNPRLYQLPVRMGYLDTPKKESELNPLSYEAWKKNLAERT
ncbi:MAG: YcaO-like family protein [Bacteriovoracaceae bacterium]|nr:YcaO-like family protein [Bacteriovoracaceae bacterium]